MNRYHHQREGSAADSGRFVALAWLSAWALVRLHTARKSVVSYPERWWAKWSPSAVWHRTSTRGRRAYVAVAVPIGLLTAGATPAFAGAFDGGRHPNHDELWLPAWRWAGALQLHDDFGVTDTFNLDRIWSFFASLFFGLTNFMWQIMLVLIEKAAGLNLVHDFSEWINQIYADVADSVVGVHDGRGGIFWLVAVIAVAAALWKSMTGRRHGAIRSLAKTLIPLALLYVIAAQSVASAQASNQLSSALESAGPFGQMIVGDDGHIAVNYVGSAGWLATTGMSFTDELLGNIPGSLGVEGKSQIANPEGAQPNAYSSRCKRYLDQLHKNYQNGLDPNAAQNGKTGGAFTSESALMELTSSMWEVSVFQQWGSTQFGNNNMSLEGSCWLAEHDSNTAPSQQIDVWNQAIPELAVNYTNDPKTSDKAAGWFFTKDDNDYMEGMEAFLVWCRKTPGTDAHAGEKDASVWTEHPEWDAVWERAGHSYVTDPNDKSKVVEGPAVAQEGNPVFDPHGDFAGSSATGACAKFWYQGDLTPGDGEGFPGFEVAQTFFNAVNECTSKASSAAKDASATSGTADAASGLFTTVANLAIEANPLFDIVPGASDAAHAATGTAAGALNFAVTVADPRGLAAALHAGGTCFKDQVFNFQALVDKAQDTGPFLFKSKQTIAQATSANKVNSSAAQQYLMHMNGHQGIEAFFTGLLTLITAIIIMFGLGGMVLGMVFVQLQAIIAWVCLPFALLLFALPGDWGNTIAKRIFRMLLAAMFAKTVYAVGFTLLLTIINLLYRMQNLFPAWVPGGSFLTALWSAAVPILAIFALRKFAKNVGLDSFTSFRGAMNMPKQVMGGTAPGLDRLQNRANNGFEGIKRQAGNMATGALMSQKLSGGGAGNNPLDVQQARKNAGMGANTAKPPMPGKQQPQKVSSYHVPFDEKDKGGAAAALGAGGPAGALGAGGADGLGAAAGALPAGTPPGGMPGLPAGPGGPQGLPTGTGGPGARGAPALGSTSPTPGAAEVGAANSNPTVQKSGLSPIGMKPEVEKSIDSRANATEKGRESLTAADGRAAAAGTTGEMGAALGEVRDSAPNRSQQQPALGQLLDKDGSVVGEVAYHEGTGPRASAHAESFHGAAMSHDDVVHADDHAQSSLSRPASQRSVPQPLALPERSGMAPRSAPPASSSGGGLGGGLGGGSSLQGATSSLGAASGDLSSIAGSAASGLG